MTSNKTFITSENIGTFAKVQNAAGFADRGEVVLVWDDLDTSDKKLAEHIGVDLKVRTSDPRSVPDKWQDDIIEEDKDPEEVDMIKQVIANPGRLDVYEILCEYSPSEPLMLWWLDKTFTEPDYFELLSDVCYHALFQTDSKYIWAVTAFGVDSGKGRFHWPESDKDSPAEKSVKKKVAEEYGMRRNELEKVWEQKDELVDFTRIDMSDGEAEELGIDLPDPSEPTDDESEETTQSNLLDL